MKFFKTLEGKITLIGSFCIIFISTAFILFTAYSIRKDGIKAAEALLKASSAEYERIVQNLFHTPLKISRHLSHIIEEGKKVNNLPTREYLNTIMKGYLKKNDDLFGVWASWEPKVVDARDSSYANKSGSNSKGAYAPYITKASSGSIAIETMENYLTEDWYVKNRGLVKSIVSEPAVYEAQGKMVRTVDVNTPITYNGKFLGLMGANVTINHLEDFANNANIYENTGKVIIVHPSGQLMALSGLKDYIGKNVLELKKLFPDSHLANQKEFSKVHINVNSSHIELLRKFKLDGLDDYWTIGVIVPISSVYKSSNELIVNQLLMIIMLTIISIAFLFFFSKSMSRKILEISGLVSNASEIVKNETSEIAALSRSVSERINEQASSIEETSASMEELSGIVENNVKSSENGMNVSSEINSYTEDTRKKMMQLENSIDKITDNSKKIEDIIKMIENIKEKTSIVDDIVFQTKLLSFNASVEAERAGEHGKGFSVVAQEVGNLAQMSGKAANEISDIVQNTIKDSEVIISETTNLISENKEKLGEVQESLNMIVSKSEEMKSESNTIFTASKEQAIGISQVNEAINVVDKTVQENSQSVDEVSKSGENLNKEALMLDDYAKGLSKLISGIE